jgi:hypothetical protein
LTGISLQQQLCKYDFSIEKSIGECYYSHKILIESHPKCNLTLKDYHKLINEKYSHTLINEIYSSGLSIQITKDGVIKLQTLIDDYNLPNDITTENILLSNDCTILNNFFRDYNLPEEIKRKIMDGKITIN